MQAEGQDEVPVVVTGHGYGEMVVDPFLQFVQDSQAIGGGKLGLRFRDGIGFARGSQRMNGHGGPLRQALRSKYTEDRIAGPAVRRAAALRHPVVGTTEVIAGNLALLAALAIPKLHALALLDDIGAENDQAKQEAQYFKC